MNAFLEEFRELHLPQSTLTMGSTQYASAIHVLMDKGHWAEAHWMLIEAEIALENRKRNIAGPLEDVKLWIVFDGDNRTRACTALHWLLQSGIETIGQFWELKLYDGMKINKLGAAVVKETLKKIAEFQKKNSNKLLTQNKEAC